MPVTSYFWSTWLICLCYVKFPSPAATDHHSVEQREATTQSEQMASHARPPHCNRRQEEGEGQCHSQLTLTPALTFEWQQDKLSVAQSVYVSLSLSFFFYICYFLSLVLLTDVYFFLSWSCISEMFTDPCGIHFQKWHSFPTSLPVFLPFCLFSPSQDKIYNDSLFSVTQHDLL